MDENTNNFVLINALQEAKNSDKDISKAFLFKNSKILVKDEYEKDEKGNKIIEVFEKINSRADIIDGVWAMTIQGTNGRIDITSINEYFLTTIASKEATNETINKLTRTFTPSMLNQPEQTLELAEQQLDPQVNIEQNSTVEIEPKFSFEQPETLEPNLTSSEFAEFTVDNMGKLGIITASHNIVRLDPITIGRWTELYGINKINKIMLKVANTEKTFECGFEEIRESNGERRNVVLIPELLQRALKIKKGAKVLVKPLLDDESPEETLKITTREEQPEKETYKLGFQQDALACQLMVEDLSSFSSFGSNDIVRFDYSVIERWKEFYDGEIGEVIISDVLLSKSIYCKFKFIKDSKFAGKGRIQIPKSIRQELAVKEGSLVILKPVVKLSA